MRRKGKTLFLLCLIIVLTACTRKEKTKILVEQEHTEQQVFSEKLKEIKLSIPSDVDFYAMPSYTVAFKELPFEKALDFFMGDKQIVEHSEEPVKNELTGTNEILKLYTAEDGSNLACTTGQYLVYSSERIDGQYLGLANAEEQRFQKNLTFASREDADRKIREILESFGVDLYERYLSCAALDYEWYREMKQQNGGGDVEGYEWPEDLECYMFQYAAAVEQMPVTNQDRYVKDVMIPASRVTVLYSPKGIEELELFYLYDVKEKKGLKKIYDADQILSVIDDRFSQILGSGQYSVLELNLEYIPEETEEIGVYQLVPGWRVYVSQEIRVQDKMDSEQWQTGEVITQMLIRAEDGRELDAREIGYVPK